MNSMDLDQGAVAARPLQKPYEHKFTRGQPVWARMYGYPWWPARVVAREDIELDAGEAEPQPRRGQVLVEFFNDNCRFAAIHERQLRSFLTPFYSNLNAYYTGRWRKPLYIAAKEAMKYCKKKRYDMEEDDGRRYRHRTPSLSVGANRIPLAPRTIR